MAQFNITDRYAQQIKNVTQTEGAQEQFPLLSRIPKSSADVLQVVDLLGVPLAKVQGQPNDTLEVDEQSYKTSTIKGFSFAVMLNDAGNLNYSGVQNALQIVRDTLYQTIELHLIWGQVHSTIAKSPILGAVAKASTQNLFSQSGDDVLLVQDNNLESVADGITKAEILSFKRCNNEGINTFDKVLINPYKGVLIGDLTPEFKITKDVRSNHVEVFGTVSVTGGFYQDGAIKVWAKQGG